MDIKNPLKNYENVFILVTIFALGKCKRIFHDFVLVFQKMLL